MYIPSQIAESGCGLGCAQGMGALTMDGTGLFGTGLFASGLDLTQWSTGEIVAALFGFFVVYSVFSTTGRGVSNVRGRVRKISKASDDRRKKQAQKLRDEARRLEGDDYKPARRSRSSF